MTRHLALALSCLLAVPVAVPAAEPKIEDLLGKWELTADVAGIRKGALFDFQKDGKLVVTVEQGTEKKTYDFKYELREMAMLKFTIGDKSDESAITTLDKTDLVCKDRDGTTMSLKRAK